MIQSSDNPMLENSTMTQLIINEETQQGLVTYVIR